MAAYIGRRLAWPAIGGIASSDPAATNAPSGRRVSWYANAEVKAASSTTMAIVAAIAPW